MSLWFILKSLFFFAYVGFAYFATNATISHQKKFYNPVYVEKDGKKVLLHDIFDAFSRKDKPAIFWKLFLNLLLFGIPKFAFGITFAFICSILLKKKIQGKNGKYTEEEIQEMEKIGKFWMTLVVKFCGVDVKKKKLPDEVILPIYQKYFGPDHKIDYNAKFSCYISNHTNFFDVICGIALYGCGFVAKEAVKSVPVFGQIAIGMDSIFVSRENANSRKEVLQKIIDRQNKFYNGENVMPFMIFPEGTTTSGRNLMSFKKGAFINLLPVKPVIVHPNIDEFLNNGCGASNVGMNFVRNVASLYNILEYIDLPVFIANDYLFEHWGSLGKEKWEIYAEACRDIMCELGKFKKTELSLRDSYRYEECCDRQKYIDKETYEQEMKEKEKEKEKGKAKKE